MKQRHASAGLRRRTVVISCSCTRFRLQKQMMLSHHHIKQHATFAKLCHHEEQVETCTCFSTLPRTIRFAGSLCCTRSRGGCQSSLKEQEVLANKKDISCHVLPPKPQWRRANASSQRPAPARAMVLRLGTKVENLGTEPTRCQQPGSVVQ